jgi:hypothetical protein
MFPEEPCSPLALPIRLFFFVVAMDGRETWFFPASSFLPPSADFFGPVW